MQKRGQLTIFIILGLVLISVTIGIIYLFHFVEQRDMQYEKEKMYDVSMLGESVKQYIASCVESVGEEAIHFVAKQGGYYNLPSNADTDIEVPYYLIGEQKKPISKQQLEEQLGLYMNEQLFFCLQNFKGFEEQGLTITQGETRTAVTMQHSFVLFSVELPITVEQDVFTKQFAHFSVRVPSVLGMQHTVAQSFVMTEEKNSVCISCLVSLVTQNNLRSEMSQVTDSVILFTLIDDSSKLEYNYLAAYEFEGEVE
jgi:hypothetical protein